MYYLLYWNGNLKKDISKDIPVNPPMRCFQLANFRFQMGVIIMGFAEYFGLSLVYSVQKYKSIALYSIAHIVKLKFLANYLSIFFEDFKKFTAKVLFQQSLEKIFLQHCAASKVVLRGSLYLIFGLGLMFLQSGFIKFKEPIRYWCV